MSRIITSEPAYRAPVSQSQRDRMEPVHPMVDERGVPWTRVRVAGEVFAALMFGVAVLSMVLA